MIHPALMPGRVAVVTGAASGIGLSACQHFAGMGMKVAMSDVAEADLAEAAEAVAARAAGGEADILSAVVDVSDLEAMSAFQKTVRERFGSAALLMNNAVARIDTGTWDNPIGWRRTMAINFMGVVNGAIAFLPDMIAAGEPALVVNLGSKQGITNPPGPRPAYTAAKAAVINYTESLQHQLRNTPDCKVTAHLLIPGWTTTGKRAHQAGAWLPAQVIGYMLAALENGDFYILCPDDEVSPAEDRRRVLWAAGDIADNRPALSRWHPDHGEAFKTFKVR